MINLAGTHFGIPGYVLFWVLFAVTFFLFIRRVRRLVKLAMLGKKEARFDHMAGRIVRALAETLLQWCNLKNVTREDKAGAGHAILFWGFCFFLIYYIIFIGFGSGLGLYRFLAGTTFEAVYSTIVDIAAVLIIIALVWAAVRRYLLKPERLEGIDSLEAGVILLLIFCLMGLHLSIEAFHETAPAASEVLWWLHYLLLLGFTVFIPYSKHLHILASPVNTVFKKTGAKGALKNIDIAQPDSYKLLSIEDFTWKQLLDGFSCTVCGRCYAACPARLSGKPLSPRELILGIKDHLLEEGPGLLDGKKSRADDGDSPAQASTPLVGSLIDEDAVWACTTCGACQEVCPASNEQMNTIINFRRHLQMGALTTTAQETLKNLRVRMNPWRGTVYARTDWAEEMDIKIVGEDDDIDILFWVGCTGALEDRCFKATQAIAAMLKASGVNFGILGEEEMCCGDPARRLGGEHLYQMLVAGNIQLLQDYNIRKIVTACPHCYNTLKNEYPQFGGDFDVVHHTEFMAEQIQKKKLELPTDRNISVTYHDPCYLGRHNGNYQAARQVLESIPGLKLVEMEKNRKDSLCCGGGGGRLWLEENIGRRISEIRFEQAVETKAETIVTACPYCLQMFESETGGGEGDNRVVVKDVAELLADTTQKES
jgi:Fe-S oxidoreductase